MLYQFCVVCKFFIVRKNVLVLLSFDLQCVKVISLSFICVVQVFHVRLVCVLCVLCVYGPSA